VTIVVAAAVVKRGDRYLITRRQQGVHLEGLWEFPGGKCEAGESIDACLRRELLEELGADAVIGDEILAVTHAYQDRSIELHFLACELTREPAPLLGQEMRWIARTELRSLRFPPADDELIALLERNER
jgi:mutator protein MutT